MPRFLFHLLSATGAYPDTDGLEFPDAEAAYMDARRAAKEMAADISLVGGDPYEYRVRVEAGDGSGLLEVPFAEVLPVRPPVAFAMTDACGRFLDVDDAFCSIQARSRCEILRLDLLAVTAEEDRDRNRADLDTLIRTGRPFKIRKRYSRGDGESIWVENRVSAFRDGVGPPRIVAGCRMLAPVEAGWEAHDKVSGVARPQTDEAWRIGQVQADLRGRVARQLASLQRL